MSIQSANKMTAASTRRAVAALQRAVQNIQDKSIPFALEAVGKAAETHARQTHTYQNRSGALEASTTFAIINPSSTGTAVYDDLKNGGQVEVQIDNPDNLIMLALIAGQPYGFWVETLYGFSVLIDSFLFLRREFVKIFGKAVKSKKLF